MRNLLPHHWWVAALLAATIPVSAAMAQPQNRFLPFSSRKPAAEQDYTLTQKSGPWLIMAASFVGEDGEHQAQRLCEELAREYKLKPYIYRHEFDFSQPITGVGFSKYYDLDENGNAKPRPAQYRALHDSRFEEIAVVIGDFPTIDDARAQKVLEQIKYMQPKTLNEVRPELGETTSQRMRTLREIQKYVSGNPDLKKKGPMRAAFMMPNPLIPEEYFSAQKIDNFVLNLNRQVTYSLLNCPGIYMVRVASFRGESTFDLNTIEEQTRDFAYRLGRGEPVKKSKLAEAAHKANRLATELRKLGVEAYEFHDRHESYVCVGAFDWVSKKDASGNVVFNPQVKETIELYRGSVEALPNMPNAVVPKVLPSLKKEEIAFDVQPIPVLVPRTGDESRTARKN